MPQSFVRSLSTIPTLVQYSDDKTQSPGNELLIVISSDEFGHHRIAQTKWKFPFRLTWIATSQALESGRVNQQPTIAGWITAIAI